MAHDIFISYAHQDKATADAVCATLEEHGFGCWIAPRDVVARSNYASAIVEAIDHSRLLLIFSAHANASPHVERELELALAKRIPTVPMFIEDIVPTQTIGYFLGAAQRFYALGQPLEKHLGLLAKQMSLILGAGATTISGPEAIQTAEVAARNPTQTESEADSEVDPLVSHGPQRDRPLLSAVKDRPNAAVDLRPRPKPDPDRRPC